MGTANRNKKLTYVTSLFIITALVGCSNRLSDEGENTTLNMQSGFGYSSMSGSYKVSIEEATVEDLVPHKVACPSQKKGKHEAKICIQICHVPPGNPENSHDKVLPLAAIKAHLGHGDYLGLCGASSNEPPAGGSGGATSGTTTDGTSDGETTDGGSIEDGSTTNEGSVDDGASGGHTEDGPTGDTLSDEAGNESIPDSGNSSGGETSSGSETSPEAEPVVPNFCVPYYEVDQDCDGFNDSTGMPYL